jgi:hypothetical protein
VNNSLTSGLIGLSQLGEPNVLNVVSLINILREDQANEIRCEVQ